MNFFGRFYFSAAFILLVALAAHADNLEDLGGFILGGSFEAAQHHALGQEWKLVPSFDNLQGHWTVEGTNVSLFVCNGLVSSISEKLEGDLEEFAEIVFSMQLEFGKPDIQIISLNSGIGDISTIDAHFDRVDGGATVQLQSVGGKRTFSVWHWIESECN